MCLIPNFRLGRKGGCTRGWCNWWLRLHNQAMSFRISHYSYSTLKRPKTDMPNRQHCPLCPLSPLSPLSLATFSSSPRLFCPLFPNLLVSSPSASLISLTKEYSLPFILPLVCFHTHALQHEATGFTSGPPNRYFFLLGSSQSHPPHYIPPNLFRSIPCSDRLVQSRVD
jgi:hypothetical protein